MRATVQDWFEIWEDQPGVWVIEEPRHSEIVKSYLVIGSEQAALIDTGMGVGDLKSLVESITVLPIIVLQSHAHNDHIGSAHQFDDVRIHESEADDLAEGQTVQRLSTWFADSEMSGPLPQGFDPVGFYIKGKVTESFLNDGDTIDLGGRKLEVWHLPGHSRGGLAFLDRENRNMFSTDVVYLRELYLINPDSSVDEYLMSLDRLARLVPAIDRLYPSHGPCPISPSHIEPMLDAMRSIQSGRSPDSIEESPSKEGGREDVSERERLLTHDFGDFSVLIARI